MTEKENPDNNTSYELNKVFFSLFNIESDDYFQNWTVKIISRHGMS